MTQGNEAHVHHLLIYTCTGVTEDHVGNGGDCDGDVAQEVQECRGGVLFAAWAVGGEVATSSVEGFVDYLCCCDVVIITQ